MVRIMLEDNEAAFLLDFLEDYDATLPNEGTNEFDLDDTPDNRRLHKEMIALMNGIPVEEMLRRGGIYNEEEAISDGQICVYEAEIVQFITDKIRRQVENNPL